ncbi:MAG: hypothetical protein ACLQSR_04765 [Limisphaerales bacterium]
MTAHQVIFDIFLFSGGIAFLSWQLAIFFNDIWLRDAQQKQLRQKFEDWWLRVADLDKLKLALACTIKLDDLLEQVFGAKLFSRRAFGRSCIGVTGLLFASMGLLGLLNHQMFVIQPWRSYLDTAKAVEKYTPELEKPVLKMSIPMATVNILERIGRLRLATSMSG